MLAIKNATLVMRDHLIPDAVLFVEDGKIHSFGEMRNTAIPEGYEGVTDLCFDFEGEIAGSKLTLEVACRNMMKHTGASIVDVFRYASYNPTRAVGLLDRGEIREGLRADLVITDYNMNVKTVILEGKVQ